MDATVKIYKGTNARMGNIMNVRSADVAAANMRFSIIRRNMKYMGFLALNLKDGLFHFLKFIKPYYLFMPVHRVILSRSERISDPASKLRRAQVVLNRGTSTKKIRTPVDSITLII